MAGTTLTDARVRALRPRKTARDVRDGKLKGFGIRVLPSGGKRFFIHRQHDGERVWRIVGDAAEIRRRRGAQPAPARMLAAIRRGESVSGAGDIALRELRRDRVPAIRASLEAGHAGGQPEVFQAGRFVPHFAGRPVAGIDRREVRDWFAALRATPVAADRSMPVLSVIMREAEVAGLRPEGSNPCRGIRRYRRKGRERFLSDEEIRRLSARLSALADRFPLQVAAIRLLLLTGCRKGEVLGLRWSDYREGTPVPAR